MCWYIVEDCLGGGGEERDFAAVCDAKLVDNNTTSTRDVMRGFILDKLWLQLVKLMFLFNIYRRLNELLRSQQLSADLMSINNKIVLYDNTHVIRLKCQLYYCHCFSLTCWLGAC